MIKKTLFFALCMVMVFSLSAFAGEGSDTVGGGKLLPQLRYDYSSTDWKTVSSFVYPNSNWDIDSHNYYLQLNWGILNNVDLIGLIGGRSVSMESESVEGVMTADCVPMFMWGVGFRTTFFRADNGFYVGGGALFVNSFSNDFDMTVTGGGLTRTFDVSYHAYTLTPELHAGWHIGDTGLTPYMGVDYVWSRAHTEWNDDDDVDYHMEHPVFMFAGLDHYITDRLYLNVEGRTNFNDGWGIGGGIGFLFDLCAPAPAPEVTPPPVIEPKLEPMSKN